MDQVGCVAWETRSRRSALRNQDGRIYQVGMWIWREWTLSWPANDRRGCVGRSTRALVPNRGCRSRLVVLLDGGDDVVVRRDGLHYSRLGVLGSGAGAQGCR
jgi:hypothetical protein